MIFTRNRSFVEHDLKIANVVIERKISVRVIIEEKLSWSTHIATIKIKMARYLGIMYKIRNHLPAETRLQIYIFIFKLLLLYKLLCMELCCKITDRFRNHGWVC